MAQVVQIHIALVRRIVALVFMLYLAACAAEPVRFATDGDGYRLPQGCRATPETVIVPVVVLPAESLQFLPGRRVNGYYDLVRRQIVLSQGLAGWRLADTLHHEQFHAYCWATRDPCCVGHFDPGAA